MSCRSPIGGFRPKDNPGEVYKVSCKSWKCEDCRKVKKQTLMRRFDAHKNQQGMRWRMITLTEVKTHENYDNAKLLTKHWNSLRSALRKHGYAFQHFFWVKEYKPRYGDTMPYPYLYPHMHLLVPVSVPTSLLKRLWLKISGASQVHQGDENYLQNPAGYMTKYLQKSDFSEGFEKYERRYGFSQKNMKLPDEVYEYELEDFEGNIVKTRWEKYPKQEGTFILFYREQPRAPW